MQAHKSLTSTMNSSQSQFFSIGYRFTVSWDLSELEVVSKVSSVELVLCSVSEVVIPKHQM